MTSFSFISFSFLLFFISLSLSAPLQHGEYVRTTQSTKSDSPSLLSDREHAAAAKPAPFQWLTIFDRDRSRCGCHGAMRARGPERSMSGWEKFIAGTMVDDKCETGYRQGLRHFIVSFLCGKRYAHIPRHQQPSLTAETPIPTTELMRMTAEGAHCNGLPLPSAPTRAPSWIKVLRGSEQKQDDNRAGAARPTSTLSEDSGRSHGTFIKKTLPSHTPSVTALALSKVQLSEAVSAFASNVSLNSATLFQRFGPELTVLTVFILVPISIFIVEAIEMIWKRWAPERFPQRGRGRLRLTGAERRLRARADWEREKTLVEESQRWWGCSREYHDRKSAYFA